MIYKKFQDDSISLLGFGLMRLPQSDDGTIDQETFNNMVQYALANGVNYFDTAWPYHNGNSETAIAQALKNVPRESYFLADKYPGHQPADTYDPASIFEKQLEKCGVDYFDFYLLHNIYENDIDVYRDPKWGIIDYFLEQKKLGRIRHLGFSTHSRYAMLKEFLDEYGDQMEFCQIQMNYLDWTLQDAKKRYQLLCDYHIPVWVMEPVRGGRLAKLSDAAESRLKALRPDDSIASWAFRWLMQHDNVHMIISGMSDMNQMKDNIRTFTQTETVTPSENALLLEIAEEMKDALPCTACRYCCEGCPQGLDIPLLLAAYNDIRFTKGGFTVPMQMDALDEDKRPSACIGCNACTQICPQKIDIPAAMKDFTQWLEKTPSWAAICKKRQAEQGE